MRNGLTADAGWGMREFLFLMLHSSESIGLKPPNIGCSMLSPQKPKPFARFCRRMAQRPLVLMPHTLTHTHARSTHVGVAFTLFFLPCRQVVSPVGFHLQHIYLIPELVCQIALASDTSILQWCRSRWWMTMAPRSSLSRMRNSGGSGSRVLPTLGYELNVKTAGRCS